jgi:hypothetical protein
MVYSEAIELVRPYITAKNVARYACTIDKMLWVEDMIMLPAGVNASINTTFGELVCEWIETQLDMNVWIKQETPQCPK